MKCPKCAATTGALDRVCPYCGAEIPASVMPSVEAASREPAGATLSAAALCNQIQEGLAALAQQSQSSTVRSVVVGLLTPPTLGIAFLVDRALAMFGRQGESPGRLVLAIDENLRKGKTAYKNDPDVMALLRKGEAEVATYHAKRHAARIRFLISCAGSIVLVAALVIAGVVGAKKRAAHQAEMLRTIVSRIQAGELSDALAIISGLPEAERQELATKDAMVKISLAILAGQDAQALTLAKGIPGAEGRAKATNFIGQRMVDAALKSADYQGALGATALLSPESSQAASAEMVRTAQAKALIEANRMDEAKRVMANIRDVSVRSHLEGLIKAKQPKAELKGF